MTDNQETKKCPFCGQKINAVAQKCRFCGKWLNEGNNEATQNQKETIPCPYCGEEILKSAKKCKHCGEWFEQGEAQESKEVTTIACPFCGEEVLVTDKQCKYCGEIISYANDYNNINIINKIAKYENISKWCWLIIGILQLIIGITALINGEHAFVKATIMCGIYNLQAVYSGWNLSEEIEKRNAEIPNIYEDLKGVIITGLINVILGAVIGIIALIIDIYVRHLVLQNKHLFTNDNFEEG